MGTKSAYPVTCVAHNYNSRSTFDMELSGYKGN